MSRTPTELEVVDAHVHFFSHAFFEGLLSLRPGGNLAKDEEVAAAVAAIGLEAPPKEALELAARWIGDLDNHGVRRAVLIASLPQDWPSVAAAIRSHPERFTGLAMANPRAGDAVEALERAFDEGGLRGVCLFPAMHRFHLHALPARRLIEAAQKRGLLVFCHAGLLKVPVRERLGIPNDFDGSYGRAVDLQRVAADYPDVSFQVPHFGAGYLEEILMLGAERPNVLVDTSSSNSWMKLAPYPLDLATVIRKTLDVFGPERILWGSDSSVRPRGWRRDLFDLQLEAFEKAGCTAAELRAIFGGNARRVFGLE
jgi:predicted TIM-barrel fold metal-dependent hydrolase